MRLLKCLSLAQKSPESGQHVFGPNVPHAPINPGNIRLRRGLGGGQGMAHEIQQSCFQQSNTDPLSSRDVGHCSFLPGMVGLVLSQ